jgi:N4-gp56 family major capsid protein
MADMNVTPSRAGLTPQIWDGRFFAEYVRKNRFSKYMGTSDSSMIQVKRDLTVKSGDSITFAAVRRLVGAGVTGNTVLTGNEEILDSRSMKLTVGVIRHAVAVTEWDEQKSSIDLRNAAKPALQNWAMEKLRGDIIDGLGSINGVSFALATAAQRNTWTVANSDRVLFGALVANGVSGVHATALLTVDNTADKMTGSILSLAKRRAQTASPHIRPIQVVDDSDEEWFVCFMPSIVFRDFRADPAVLAVNKDARPRENGWMDNPLFSGGDLMWDGVIVREIPELPTAVGLGNAGIDVAASYLCGAQALGVGWAQTTRTRTNVLDYDFTHGVGIQEMRAVGKLRFGRDPATDTGSLVDQGVFTIWTSAVADA